ncbi:MAG: GntR family transcriptional regulator [Rubrivivax sp.]|nr:GntR family transcriptional regulator [Rubrivivax sp.]
MKAPALSRPRGRRPGGALYKQIAAQIEADIVSGRHAVGHLLPTEAEFGQRLDVGRHTVREALRLLAQDGLIVRRAGSGSTVIASARRRVFAQEVSQFDQWFNYPASVHRHHVEQRRVVADAALAASLGCAQGTAWLRVGALRTLDDASAPLCWVDLYLQPRFAAVLKGQGAETAPLHEQVEAMFGVAIAEVEVTLWVGRVPAEHAAALAAEASGPALWLRRRYLGADGELLQATLTVHPEDRYVYAMKFRRSTPSSTPTP